MRTVLIAYKSMPHYRVPFFEGLRRELELRGVRLHLVYGEPSGGEALKQDTLAIDWARRRRNLAFGVRGTNVIYQPVFFDALRADLVIVEQASKLLVNYLLLGLQEVGGPRLAFWGHGKNFQSPSQHYPAERLKKILSKRVHWWFAYNERSSAVVEDLGFPRSRITSVKNTIDTQHLHEAVKVTDLESVAQVRGVYGIGSGPTCVFVGGMYELKRIPFLIESAKLVKRAVPDFELVLAGGGEHQHIAASAAEDHSWIHYVGPVFGAEKAALYKMSKLILMPGLVGLAVIDSFAAGVPMVTTNVPYHSPEIEYLVSGENGLVVDESHSPSAYAAAIADLLRDDVRREALVRGCAQSRQMYTMEDMVTRFADGVMQALES